MTVQHPSAVVTLWLRVDEGADTAALTARLTQSSGTTAGAAVPAQASAAQRTGEGTASVAQRIADLLDQQRVVERAPADSFEGGEATRASLLAVVREQLDEARAMQTGLGDEGRAPEWISGLSPDGRYVRGGILPRKVEIERNGIREADTAALELNWSDVPFDPRLVRACGVEIILGTVDPNAYSSGMRGAVSRITGQLSSVVSQSPAAVLGEQHATRFVGWVDQWEVAYDAEEGDTVKLECRDMTALLIDTPFAGTGIDLSLPIDEGVRRLLAEYPTVAGIPVFFGDAGDPAPGVPPVPAAALPPARRARRGRTARATRSGDQKMTLWDHITDVCVQAGLVPLVRDYQLRIVNPRTLYVGAHGAPSPRRLVYGRNLEQLSFARKLGGTKVPTVEVRSYDPTLGRTRWARWPVPPGAPQAGIFGVVNPPRALRPNEVTPSGSRPDERINTFTIRYGGNEVVLAAAARALFEQIGRQEIEGSLSTTVITSESGERGDLLSLVAGDAVELLVAASPEAEAEASSTAEQIEGLGRRARTAYLRTLGWEQEVAERFAALQEAAQFQTTFRVANVRLRLDDQGLSVEIDFINYIVVREDAAAGVSESAAETATDAAPSPEVDALVRGRHDETANDLRRVSRLRRMLTAWREAGILSEETYQNRLGMLQEVERDRIRAVQRGA